MILTYVLGMRARNYIKTVPQYFKIAAIALVAIHVGTNIDSWFNFAFILDVPCDIYGNKQEIDEGLSTWLET
jgi:hypothetical protein